jgi:hypothetical protein
MLDKHFQKKGKKMKIEETDLVAFSDCRGEVGLCTETVRRRGGRLGEVRRWLPQRGDAVRRWLGRCVVVAASVR